MTARLSPYDQHWADLAVRMGRAPKSIGGRIMTLDTHDDFAPPPAPALAKREPIIEKKKST